jgi:hypothetical protein
MKLELCIKKEFDVKYLAVTAGIRYAEDVTVNGEKCDDLANIPCNDGEYWQAMIDVDSGVITNWEKGKKASIHAKVCDDGTYSLLDASKQEIKTIEGYVLDCLAIGDNGHGDYIIMDIDENGKIDNWKPEFEEFLIDED